MLAIILNGPRLTRGPVSPQSSPSLLLVRLEVNRRRSFPAPLPARAQSQDAHAVLGGCRRQQSCPRCWKKKHLRPGFAARAAAQIRGLVLPLAGGLSEPPTPCLLTVREQTGLPLHRTIPSIAWTHLATMPSLIHGGPIPRPPVNA